MTFLAVWSALKRVPRAAWGLLLGALLLLAVYAAHRRVVGRAYADGRRAATVGVAFDSALVARVAEVVALRTAHTDTVTVVVTRTQREVREVIETLPDSLRAFPDVQRLVSVTTRLVGEVDSLKAAHVAERLAWVERAKVDSANVYALRVIATARGDSVRVLSKRPTRKKAALYALLGVGAGFLGGLAR